MASFILFSGCGIPDEKTAVLGRPLFIHERKAARFCR